MASEARLQAQIRLRRVAAGGRLALDVNLDFGPGWNVLFGPSGSGKTTILSAISGLLRPDAGRISLLGRTLFESAAKIDLPPNERRVALVFQSLALFPHLDAVSNVTYGLPRTLSRSDRTELAESWLHRMRVAHLSKRRPDSFSGGEAQRVALARALASEPHALLLDEPFSALDEQLTGELCVELTRFASAAALPVVLVTHDRRLARALGQTVTVLRAGSVEQVGLSRDILTE